jgi:murein DD-endopeptidase MepM/ murein hydrolase activator NlpD
VQPGDTLFGIAKRYNVPVAALMEANGLSYGASIKAGQRLNLPGASSARGGQEFGRAPERRAVPAKETVSADAPVWNGRYTMNPGDSLYSIARNHQTTLADLQRANGITDPTKVRAGTVLIVPGKGEAASDRSASTGSPQTNTTQTTTTGGPRVVHIPLGQTQTHSQTTGMGEGSKIASRGDTVSDATEAAAPSSGARFRWPVTGRVLAGFGKRPDGSHNDGINLAVQQGTEVRAAEGGRVVYAGSELKGYGNLVLIRHDNGWVTAYAHNEELLVKRDEAVKRGQVIAKAGRTGNVDQAQLHFELRQGAKPIDPMPYLDRN